MGEEMSNRPSVDPALLRLTQSLAKVRLEIMALEECLVAANVIKAEDLDKARERLLAESKQSWGDLGTSSVEKILRSSQGNPESTD